MGKIIYDQEFKICQTITKYHPLFAMSVMMYSEGYLNNMNMEMLLL
ncbi:MAG: hypothetical protein ACI8RP_000027 [Urechidicola sp.]|jgi:hypothetical protein